MMDKVDYSYKVSDVSYPLSNAITKLLTEAVGLKFLARPDKHDVILQRFGSAFAVTLAKHIDNRLVASSHSNQIVILLWRRLHDEALNLAGKWRPDAQ